MANGVPSPRTLLTVLGVAGSLVALYSFAQSQKAPRRLGLVPGRKYRWTWVIEPAVPNLDVMIASLPAVFKAENMSVAQKGDRQTVQFDAPAIDDEIELPQGLPGLPGAITKVKEV